MRRPRALTIAGLLLLAGLLSQLGWPAGRSSASLSAAQRTATALPLDHHLPLIARGAGFQAPTITATPSGTPTPRPGDTVTPGDTPTPGPTDTATPTPGPEDTPTPTDTPTATSMPGPTDTPTPTVPPTDTPTPGPTDTPTATPPPTNTPTLPPTSTPNTPYPVQVTLAISEQLRWIEQGPAGGSYDLMIVGDYSGSNRECWGNHNTCAAPNRRIDGEAAAIRTLVNELLARQNGAGADHRVGFVSFGHMVGSRSVARVNVPLTATTTTALSMYAALVGTPANPRTIPNTELTGASPLGQGLSLAFGQLDAAPREIDRNGNPVRRAMIVLADDTANVFVDPPYAGLQNNASLNPFRCQSTTPGQSVTDDPQAQYTCPAANHPSNTTGARPPLRAAVEIADAGRSAQRAQIFAVAYGSPASSSAELLRLHLIAPTDYAKAATPAQLGAEIDRVIGRLGAACQPRAASSRPAAGAGVQILDASQTVVFSGTVGADGLISATLLTGEYTLRASHADVVAPADPEQRARTYGRLVTDAQPAPSPSAPLSIRGAGQTRALLTLSDPASAACP